jgi:hypothetical protein
VMRSSFGFKRIQITLDKGHTLPLFCPHSFLLSPHISLSILPIQPVFTLTTTKNISSLAWIPSPPYESLAISFLFDSTVDLIDCNLGTAIGRLATKNVTRRGFTKIHILPTDISSGSSKQNPPALSSSSWSYLVAGSSYGQLFMWRFPSNSSDFYITFPIWEALGDPTSHPNESLGIVGIFTPLQRNGAMRTHASAPLLLLSLTRSGHLCLWDVMNSSLLSFSSTRTPLLLQSTSIWDNHRSHSNTTSTSLINTADIDPSDPLSVSFPVISPSSSSGKTLYPLHGKLFLILSSGERLTFDLSSVSASAASCSSSSSSALTPLCSDSRVLRPSSTQAIIVQDTLQPWNTGSVVSNQNPLIAHRCDVKGMDFMPCPHNVSFLSLPRPSPVLPVLT